MSVVRRNFLKKGLLGLLSMTLLPASISFLRNKDHIFSVNDLFTRLAFKKRFFSTDYLNENFELSLGESEQISRKGIVYYFQNTFCVQEFDQFSPGLKNTIVSIYEKTFNGYKKVISLNHMELNAFSNMISYLKRDHNISDPVELRRLLIPTFKSRKHFASGNRVDGVSASQHGYYTSHGYCSMQINAKKNSFKIYTKLLNFKKAKAYQNSYKFHAFA
jgi:hypothetical protein